ncbi:MAG: cobaltochelatase subunit CobN [Pseudomonadota bacterium]
MHLLATQPGTIADGSAAVDLGQSPGDIVVLTAADSEIAALAAARRRLEGEPGLPSLRLANLLRLSHNLSVDLYVDKVIERARLVVVRLLGGRGYWPYGVDRLVAACREGGIPLALLPGDDQPDPELAERSTLAPEIAHRLWQYLVHGGPENAAGFLAAAAAAIGVPTQWREPAPMLAAGLYWPAASRPSLADIERRWRPGATVAIVFYRALVQAADTGTIDALIDALGRAGLNALPLFVTSLKDRLAAATLAALFAEAPPAAILNLTGFALAGASGGDPLAAPDCPVLQIALAGGTAAAWRAATSGLAPRDIAMSVALPELDGRIFSRAVAFKAPRRRDRLSEAELVGYAPLPDRVTFVAELAAAWTRLAAKPAHARRIAVVLANYPNRDGRIGNGVGLDTPASVVGVLKVLSQRGYRVDGAPGDGAELISRLLAGPTNDPGRPFADGAGEFLALADYAEFFAGLPAALQAKVSGRWGEPDRDPCFRSGGFRLGIFRCANLAICLQPARGYNLDPKRSYHDPDLAPPHSYLAFYAWARRRFQADAVIHFGKHGNLEWLPGKALALSGECFPEAALGPTPHLYPFIVNDPGEGTQAKRRAGAVIVDHLTPPLTRAGSYGPLAALETLVDEYYQATGLDPRRTTALAGEIRDLAASTGIGRDCGIAEAEPAASALVKLDAWLCEIKDMQIRDGLHVFGEAPADDRLVELALAIARVPRGGGQGREASLLRALAADLGLAFDPLDCALAAPWTGPRPAALAEGGPWRTNGDAIERLERLAHDLVARTRAPAPGWTRAGAVLDWIAGDLVPAITASGEAEIAGLLRGLDGRRVAAGPAGAPTRGRPEVLPTGRNFYSLDPRSVPTPSAWLIGWKSAELLLARHLQDHGAWPTSLALSAWGTSNMRTGGDDIAQAMALIGTRPTWDAGTRRVTGFEILPPSVLDRPRIDVTLRVSGFFRDAFANLIDLYDSAARAVAALDEPAAINPLGPQVRAEALALAAAGADPEAAARRAGARVFGSKPGAYGAGLQALIDERGWESADDLARAYLTWGGYAYGGGADGEAAHEAFARRLGRVQAVVHNQDNREHDLLDSDDYYQFEGGLAAAVRHLSGRAPAVYHNDHSRPETPKIRTLEEEVARTLRARVVNPKWIAGVMRHGYKGAFEMAATVDYLFAFAATAGAVRDHHFDAVFEAYIGDEAVRAFLAAANPDALAEMSERLLEAEARGLWRPRSNSAHDLLAGMARRRQPAEVPAPTQGTASPSFVGAGLRPRAGSKPAPTRPTARTP